MSQIEMNEDKNFNILDIKTKSFALSSTYSIWIDKKPNKVYFDNTSLSDLINKSHYEYFSKIKDKTCLCFYFPPNQPQNKKYANGSLFLHNGELYILTSYILYEQSDNNTYFDILVKNKYLFCIFPLN